MALSTKPYKGARDFYPEDKRLQKYLFSKIRQVVESFGYEEYDAPILESLELYTAKTGEEIVNEQTYSFTDRGGREVVIRPEMTPTVSRMVAARRQELAYPLRWYSIPNLWRYERPQRGRLREHWQLNVDIFGVANSAAELELIQVSDQIYKSFGATPDMYEIRLNSRQLLEHALHNYLELNADEAQATGKLIDRMHKLERQDFIGQLDAVCTPRSRENGVVEKLLNILSAATIKDLPPEIRDHEAAATIKAMLDQLTSLGITNARFDVSLMRGFDYYTDLVFEIFDTHPENNRSMMGGGRYDGLVGLFGVEPIATAGFGLGDATLANFLELHGLTPTLHSETDLYVALVGDVLPQAQPLLASLRAKNIALAVDFSGRKIGDQLKAADKKGITYALVIGQAELESGQFVLKHLQDGSSQELNTEGIISFFHDRD